MNVNERLNKLKQELPTILFISTIHIWCCFNFPAYIRLGFPLNYILSTAVGIFGVVAYVFMLTAPQKIVSYLKFDQIDETVFGGHILKQIMPIWIIFVYHASMLVTWYKDFYHMPSIWYAILYVYCAVVYVLLFRATNRDS